MTYVEAYFTKAMYLSCYNNNKPHLAVAMTILMVIFDPSTFDTRRFHPHWSDDSSEWFVDTMTWLLVRTTRWNHLVTVGMIHRLNNSLARHNDSLTQWLDLLLGPPSREGDPHLLKKVQDSSRLSKEVFTFPRSLPFRGLYFVKTCLAL